jgi:major outer membrane protein
MSGTAEGLSFLSVSTTYRLLAATSLFGMLAFIPIPAKAADFPVEETNEDLTAGPYFSVTGAYLFNESEDNLSFDPDDEKLGDLEALSPGDDGWLAGVTFGAPIDPVWDWKVSGHAVWLSESKDSSLPPNSAGTEQFASNDLDYQYLDIEFGHRLGTMTTHNARLFAGVRLLHASNDIDYSYFDDNIIDKLGNYEHENSVLAIGPRLGVDADFPISDTALQLVTSLSGSVLFGRFERDFSFFEDEFFSVDSGSESSSDHGTIFNLEGLAALRFNVGANSSLDVGYRAQHWWNMLDSVFEAESDDGDFDEGERTEVLVHGPFATFTVKLP